MSATRSSYLNIRVEPKVKASAKRVLKKVGISASDAVNLFLHQIIAEQSIPCFRSHVPNARTAKILREALSAKPPYKTYATTEELFEEVLGKDWRK